MSQIDQQASGTPAEATTSMMAVFSLVSGIIGFCVIFIGGLAGIIFGVVALVRIGQSDGRIKGKGLAVAGVGVSVASLLTSCLLLGILLPAIGAAREEARTIQFQSQMRQVGLAMMAYAEDHEWQLPAAETWSNDLQPYLSAPALLESPHFPDQGRAVAMNRSLGGMSLDNISRSERTVLLFSISPGGPIAGGRELLSDPPQDQPHLILFADGHVERVLPEELGLLVWEPIATQSERPSIAPE